MTATTGNNLWAAVLRWWKTLVQSRCLAVAVVVKALCSRSRLAAVVGLAG
jgi:hypothetical protein